ncbi:MAG: sensor domain-containing diguanylate cyclase [Chloroflexi bacterium]|nr:sensor domain-containing diguanylate cyclase [Chloroflexota bacterium]
MAKTKSERYYQMLFDHAPISLWEQDFSSIKNLFESLRRQGVQDLNRHLDEHPELIEEAMLLIKVVNVNLQTLAMFGVKTKDEMLANLGHFFRDEMRVHFRDELLSLWAGRLAWRGEGVNYTLTGEPLDILLSWRILPGSEETWKQVLVTIEDITTRKQAERELALSENRLRGLFENSPISLWEEDYSQIKNFFDNLRAVGVKDLMDYLQTHPEDVARCMSMIRVLDVNQKTLTMFGERSKAELLQNLDKVFRDEMRAHFQNELADLWSGKLSYETDGVNYTLGGEPLHVHLYLSVFPGYKQTLGRVLVALEDVTARRKAEEYLRYLGSHDVMTGLYNRAYYEEEMKRLSGGRRHPVSIIIADLDGLKEVNDKFGHKAGDNLIRRAAETLKAGFRQEDVLARIGGDEFAVIMPNTDAATAREAAARIESLTALNNKFYGEPTLSISLGASTGNKGSDLEAIMRAADDNMYKEKRIRHQRSEPPRN